MDKDRDLGKEDSTTTGEEPTEESGEDFSMSGVELMDWELEDEELLEARRSSDGGSGSEPSAACLDI